MAIKKERQLVILNKVDLKTKTKKRIEKSIVVKENEILDQVKRMGMVKSSVEDITYNSRGEILKAEESEVIRHKLRNLAITFSEFYKIADRVKSG